MTFVRSSHTTASASELTSCTPRAPERTLFELHGFDGQMRSFCIFPTIFFACQQGWSEESALGVILAKFYGYFHANGPTEPDLPHKDELELNVVSCGKCGKQRWNVLM
jgi:hypothetical protein